MLVAVALLLSVLEVPCWAQPEQSEEPKFVINGTAFQLLFQRKHNSFRSKVAMGTATVDGVKYGPAKNMYRLVTGAYMVEAAEYELTLLYRSLAGTALALLLAQKLTLSNWWKMR